MDQPTQAEALKLADKLNSLCVAEFAWPTLNHAAVMLRRLHARVAELESLRASQKAERAVPADGSFLLLPERPAPDARANTVGLSWDAYSGATMLAYGRACSDAAMLAAAPVQQAAPAGDARDTFNACHAFIAAYARMEQAMADGYNVHGAISGIVAAEDGLRAAIASQQP